MKKFWPKKCINCIGKGYHKDNNGFTVLCFCCAGSGKITKRQAEVIIHLADLSKRAGLPNPII